MLFEILIFIAGFIVGFVVALIFFYFYVKRFIKKFYSFENLPEMLKKIEELLGKNKNK